MLYAVRGDAALAACDYDSAIREYSAAIDLHSASDTIYASRSKARSEKKLWEEALLDAQKVRWHPISVANINVHFGIHRSSSSPGRLILDIS